MPETTPLIKAALNLRGGAGFDVYVTKITNAKYCYAKKLHQQIKQYIFLLCLLSDHELLDCLLHMFVLRILVILSYNFHKLLLNILKKVRQIGFEPILTGA